MIKIPKPRFDLQLFEYQNRDPTVSVQNREAISVVCDGTKVEYQKIRVD